MLRLNQIQNVTPDNELVLNGELIGKFTDEQAIEVVRFAQSILNGKKAVATPAATATRPVSRRRKANYGPAQDAEIKLVLDNTGMVVKFDGYVAKDTYEVVKSCIPVNKDNKPVAVWNKNLGGFKFSTKKSAAAFIKAMGNTVSGASRDKIRAGWNSK